MTRLKNTFFLFASLIVILTAHDVNGQWTLCGKQHSDDT